MWRRWGRWGRWGLPPPPPARGLPSSSSAQKPWTRSHRSNLTRGGTCPSPVHVRPAKGHCLPGPTVCVQVLDLLPRQPLWEKHEDRGAGLRGDGHSQGQDGTARAQRRADHHHHRHAHVRVPAVTGDGAEGPSRRVHPPGELSRCTRQSEAWPRLRLQRQLTQQLPRTETRSTIERAGAQLRQRGRRRRPLLPQCTGGGGRRCNRHPRCTGAPKLRPQPRLHALHLVPHDGAAGGHLLVLDLEDRLPGEAHSSHGGHARAHRAVGLPLVRAVRRRPLVPDQRHRHRPQRPRQGAGGPAQAAGRLGVTLPTPLLLGAGFRRAVTTASSQRRGRSGERSGGGGSVFTVPGTTDPSPPTRSVAVTPAGG
uniref:Uncharacterized protein LOC116955041 isoform X3 n=1 Tax=Petromyzon marinus TaxID=7757 RepID=A0AAJ7U8V3_PETMA|nr:uncharacterized protein LOC116955041 isoform X3 [Petromyzon marinus]